jgi:hypothetical protein
LIRSELLENLEVQVVVETAGGQDACLGLLARPRHTYIASAGLSDASTFGVSFTFTFSFTFSPKAAGQGADIVGTTWRCRVASDALPFTFAACEVIMEQIEDGVVGTLSTSAGGAATTLSAYARTAREGYPNTYNRQKRKKLSNRNPGLHGSTPCLEVICRLSTQRAMGAAGADIVRHAKCPATLASPLGGS